MIYSHTIADRVLSSLIQDTSLCLNSKYPIEKEDFEPVQFHKILYATIYNLAIKGVKIITIIDIEEFLKPYDLQYNIYNDNNGSDYISTILELGDKDNYEYYYNELRKYSCLREYKEQGFDITEIYDESKDDNSGLDGWKIEDIVGYFEGKQCKIKRQFLINKVKEEYVAGTDFMETKEKFKTEPLVGNSFQSPFINAIFRGMYGFIIRVAKSGGGKSILSICDLCKTTILEYWDYDKKCFVKNKSRVGNSMFINTELEIREELDVIIICWISGVPRNHIIDGVYEEGEEERVDYANEVLLKSGLYIVDDPEFTTKSLVETIKDYSLNKNCKTCCFDYIQSHGILMKEIASETKVPQREDMILLALTDRLKQVQRECDISLISSVQTNGREDEMEYPNESCLAGGKSQVRKTNGTMIMLEPTKKELEQVSSSILNWNKKNNKIAFGNNIIPNNVIHIIKGRANKYKKNTKIFQYIDLSTGRTYDMFCTDKNNCQIDVEKFIIEYNKE